MWVLWYVQLKRFNNGFCICGNNGRGRGERFWPLSTSQRPKQLHDLVGDKTLIAQAVERLEGLIPIERIFVITNADIVNATLAAAPKLKPENVIGEPFGRDTAAAVACAAAVVKSRDDQAVFAILTADQVMGDVERFPNYPENRVTARFGE